MSSFTWADLRQLQETRRYSGLLARTTAIEPLGAAAEPRWDELILDMLEPVSEPQPAAEQCKRLIEDGEFAAARALEEMEGTATTPAPNLVRLRARYAQEVEQQVRRTYGNLLRLKDTTDPRLDELNQRVEELVHDQFLREARPGRLVKLLVDIDTVLETVIEETVENLRAEVARLKGKHPHRDTDLATALNRFQEFTRSRETLPLAQMWATIVGRAIAGGLTEADLRMLHAETGGRGRLVRVPSEFDQSPTTAVEVLSQLDAGASPARWASDFDREKVRDLFRSLVPTAGTLDTPTVARRLLAFLDLNGDTTALHRESLGSWLAVSFRFPRVPALSRKYYPNGVYLVLPLRTEETTFPSLLRAAPKDALLIMFYPGRLRQSLRQRFGLTLEVPHLDIVDLLRLAECLRDQRQRAVQQILLTRLPLNKTKPYQGGGPVSSEMFRGRRDVIARLKQPKGGTVLFSGRMMGKSSILTKIHADIQAAASGGGPRELSVFVSSAAEDLLTPLVEKLADLVPGSGRTFLDADRRFSPRSRMTPAERKEKARQRLQNARSLIKAALRIARTTILIDEADKFAAADGERPREESVAWMLRDLEHENPERLRIVFAGFQTIHHQALFRNGAFANWYGLEQLGPLEVEDSRALVTEPFADFGFVFASESGVQRILEFTGRHPLLIQETCSRLMERMGARRRGTDEDESILVEAGDVEAVCRDDQLRDRLRQVLSLNLDEYPRLKLMAYLILFAASSGSSRSQLHLDSFRLDDLKEVVIEFYEERFNEFFDDRSIGVLVQELEALGLVSRNGDKYAFANRTFANMLREDRGFDRELGRLLESVTSSDRSDARRFPTLADEDLERLLRPSDEHVFVIGLKGVAKTWIAERVFRSESISDAFLLSAGACQSTGDLLASLRKALSDPRKSFSVADLLVGAGIRTLVLDDADAICEAPGFGETLANLQARNVRTVSFGGAPLARFYVSTLAGVGVDVISLRRLRWKDIKAWGERYPRTGDDVQIVLDDRSSQELERVTGGFLPLLSRFADALRKSGPARREFIPAAKEIEAFAKTLSPAVIEEMLLKGLSGDERTVLDGVGAFMVKEGLWDVEWEFIDDGVFGRLPQHAAGPRAWLDAYETLRLLDLVGEAWIDGRRTIHVEKQGPLAQVFRSRAV